MSSLAYAVGNNPVSANFTASLSVSGNQDWTVQSDTPWLSVTPTSGSAATIPTVLTATVDASQVDALDSGTYTANIRLSGGNIITVPVTLNVARTQVNYASPYVQVSGATGDVIIRGEHFDLAPPTGVVFGSAAATAFTVMSPTEIHATHPPLAAGTYVVHVPNAQNIDRTRAQLTIFDAQNVSAASLDYPGSNPQGVGISSLFYDAAAPPYSFMRYPPRRRSCDTPTRVQPVGAPPPWQSHFRARKPSLPRPMAASYSSASRIRSKDPWT